MKTIILLSVVDSQLYLGILASAIVAVVALFAFFLILRPRIKIMPIVAYRENGEENKKGRKCEIALVNKSIFSCNDIRIRVDKVGTNRNESEQYAPIGEGQFLSINGRFHNENTSVRVFLFKLEDEGFPEQIRISVLARHSVSNVEIGKERICRVTDFREGTYEKGVFVPERNTYKQSVMRRNLKVYKWVTSILLITFLIAISLLTIFSQLTVDSIVAISALSLSIILTLIAIWQFYLHSKADAYSSVIAYHVMEHVIDKTVIAVIRQQDKDDKTKIKKAVPEDVTDVEESSAN